MTARRPGRHAAASRGHGSTSGPAVSSRELAWRWHCYQHSHALRQAARQAEKPLVRWTRWTVWCGLLAAAALLIAGLALLLDEHGDVWVVVLVVLGILMWGGGGHGHRHGRGSH